MRSITSLLSKRLFLVLGMILYLGFLASGQLPASTKISALQIETSDLKLAAFAVLQTKCNVCHVKKNPRKVFTMENMEDLAPKIYKQVFIKRRMPKGKEIQLSDEEYQSLERWLSTLNNK